MRASRRSHGWVVALWLGACAPTTEEALSFDAAMRDGGAVRDSGLRDAGVGRDSGAASDVGAASDTGGVRPTDTGETTVLREDCATPFDDNNDGVANENCPCTPGTEQMCFERTSDRFGGMCRMGRQRCEGTGEFGMWTACAGSWLPLAAHREACEITQPVMEMTATRAPVDIIWFIDTSGSMVEETRNLNANLNRFASTMAASGVDYRVIMVGRRGTGNLQVCVPTPLGGAACGDGPRFRHIDQSVNSNDGLQQLVNTYPRWRDFLRADSLKFFVAVTDDESRPMTADTFDRTVRAWPGFTSYVFNSIVGYESRSDCPTLASRGGQYLTLTMRTRGDQARVCATDWSAIFTTFASGIARRANSFLLAEPARADTVQVWVVTAGGMRTRLTTGWSYDPAMNRVVVDPASLPPPGSHLEILYRPAAASP